MTLPAGWGIHNVFHISLLKTYNKVAEWCPKPITYRAILVGNEDRAAHFRSTHMGQGATTALPIWGIFMKKCYADSDLDVSKEPFERPEDLQIKVDCWTPKKAADSTDVPTDEPNMDEFGL